MFEDRTPIWPQGKKKHPEDYPWRVEAEPVTVLSEDAFVAAESVVDELEHARKWPAEHWHLAFQGQLRTVSESDARLLASGSPAAAGDRRRRVIHERHFTVEEAESLLGEVEPMLRSLRGARDRLTDAEAHEALTGAAPGNGGGGAGRGSARRSSRCGGCSPSCRSSASWSATSTAA